MRWTHSSAKSSGVIVGGDDHRRAGRRIEDADVVGRAITARAGLVRHAPAGGHARLYAAHAGRRIEHPAQQLGLVIGRERRGVVDEQAVDVGGGLAGRDGVLVAVQPVHLRLEAVDRGAVVADAAIEGAHRLDAAVGLHQQVGGRVVADLDRALHQGLDGQGFPDGQFGDRRMADHVGGGDRDFPIQLLLARLHAQEGGGGEVHLEGRAIDEPLITARHQAAARAEIVGDEAEAAAVLLFQRRKVKRLRLDACRSRGGFGARAGGQAQRAQAGENASAVRTLAHDQAA